MTTGAIGIQVRAAELRRAFDESFARERGVERAGAIDLLMLRVDTQVYGVLLSEIAGLYNGKKITGFPSPIEELLGLVALRGTLVPVYDLGALLGGAPKRTPSSTIVAKQAPLALAFDGLERHLRVDRAAISAAERNGTNGGFIHELVRTEEGVRPILDLGALVSAVKARVQGAQGQNKER
jgi:chemotaxis signal transduction protein